MKHYQYKKPSFLILLFLIFFGCTKNFEDINTNPYGAKGEIFKADFQITIQPLINIQRSIVQRINWEYQLQQNLNADIYSGYMMTPTPFNGNSNNSNYFMMDGWNSHILVVSYNQIMEGAEDFNNAKTEYSDIDFSDADALVKVVKVLAMSKASDIFGPIIYTKYGKPNADLSVDYDSQQEAYYAFFRDLDSARLLIRPFADGTKTVGTTFTKGDIISAGDPARLLKLINTIQLRLALRIVYADPATAKIQGEKALDPQNGGLIEENSDNAFINYGLTHPIYDVIYPYSDIRAGAPLACYLNGFNDSRISKYLIPATDEAVKGQYIGIRNGVDIDGKSRYSGYSIPNALADAGNYFSNRNGMAKISTASEAYFLKAEAALRGWANTGDVKNNYETAVTKSFEEWGAGSITEYLKDSLSTAQPYVDPKALTPGANNIPAGNPYLSTITIKWNDNDNFEKKFERIITQKWLALYPDGQEAWTEFRRTKYPKLFPVVINNSGGIVTGFIKRLPIPSNYQSTNQGGYAKALATLGGPDNANTKLWWDKKP